MDIKSKARTSILAAAANLFARYGYDKTSVDDIAKLAHKAKTSMYYHFDSKLSIFKGCLENEFHRLKENMDAVMEANGEISAKCLAEYLMARVELMPKMSVYKNYLCGLAINGRGGDLKETADAVRKDFDAYEYQYFYDTAQTGREVGVFSDKVSSSAFAKMMIVLLKGLEIQFFMSENVEAIRSTFESLIELLIYNRATDKIKIAKDEI